jgi:hypothetical protein
MFVPCAIRHSRNVLVFTTPLFYILAPTCFGSSLPSSGSFLDPSELLKIQIEWVVYHKMCGYVACVPDCLSVVLPSWEAQQTDGTTTIRHTGRVTIRLLKIRFNIIIPSTPRFSKWSVSFRSPYQNPVCTSPVPKTNHLLRPAH